MAELYADRGYFEKASPLLENIVSARERVQGSNHPDVAVALNNWGSVLEDRVRRERISPSYLLSCGHVGCLQPAICSIVRT